MMSKILKYTLLSLVIFTAILAGYLYYTLKTSCFGFAVYPEVIFSKKIVGDKEYILTTTKSGFQEKEFFINLFNKPLEKDECGVVISKPIYTDIYDPFKKNEVIIFGDKFRVKEGSSLQQTDLVAEWLPPIECGDLLEKIGHKPTNLEYVSCQQKHEQIKTINALYRVEGSLAKAVESYFVKTAGMGELKYHVYGLTIRNKKGSYDSKIGYGYKIIMYPNTSHLDPSDESNKIKNMGKNIEDYPFFLVEVVWPLEQV